MHPGRDPGAQLDAIRGPRALFHVLGAPGPIEAKTVQNQWLAGHPTRTAAPAWLAGARTMFVTNNTKNKKYEQKQAIRGPVNVSRETISAVSRTLQLCNLQFTSLQKIILQIFVYCLIISYTK
jgi:hypothetical protein